MKTTIQRYPSLDQAPYAHLAPVVEALIAAGNEPVRPDVFYLDRDGWRCDLRKPIDYQLLRDEFEFPKTITLCEELGTVFCSNTWVEIKGPNRNNCESPIKRGP